MAYRTSLYGSAITEDFGCTRITYLKPAQIDEKQREPNGLAP